ASNQIHTTTRSLGGGNYQLRVEYFENIGDAGIAFWWEQGFAYPQWRGDYYTNRNLSGNPAVTRNDVDINFDWGTGSPAGGIPADNFSVRWTRTLSFNAGTYTFHVRMNDGARVYIDGNLVIDDWREAPLRELTADVPLTTGLHTIVVEYFEGVNTASVQFWWDQPGVFAQWRGDYFTNRNLAGNPAVTRNDTEINFNWGTGSPASGIPADNFSV